MSLLCNCCCYRMLLSIGGGGRKGTVRGEVIDGTGKKSKYIKFENLVYRGQGLQKLADIWSIVCCLPSKTSSAYLV